MKSNITLLGKRVMLNQPVMAELALELPESVKQEIIQEEMKKFTKLTVFAVGTEVEDFTPGMEVYVTPTTLAMAEVIDVDAETKILVRASDITMIWNK